MKNGAVEVLYNKKTNIEKSIFQFNSPLTNISPGACFRSAKYGRLSTLITGA